jgi:hypothetical protein
MNSYVNLMLETEGVKDRLQRLFQSTLEVKENDYSEQPLFWLAVWPAPVALACTIFIFFRQGFHFQNGMLILGRRRG